MRELVAKEKGSQSSLIIDPQPYGLSDLQDGLCDLVFGIQ